MCGIALLLQFAHQCNLKAINNEVGAKIELLELKKNEEQSQVKVSTEEILQRMTNKIKFRGPDQQDTKIIELFGNKLSICGSLLALRGQEPQPQPLADENLDNILVWNGEVFGGSSYEKIEQSNQSDSKFVFELLKSSETVDDILQIMASIEGPFAFVFFKRKLNRLFFGKDSIGRRSLLFNYNSERNILLLCSNAVHVGEGFSEWTIIHPQSLFSLVFTNENSFLESHDWSTIYSIYNLNAPLQMKRKEIEPTLSKEELNTFFNSKDYQQQVQEFLRVLSESVRKRVCNVYDADTENHSRIAVMFSGGIDSVIVTALALKHLNQDNNIDLLNVSFDGNQAADRQQSIISYHELQQLFPEKKFQLILIDVSKEELEKHQQTIEQLIYPRTTVLDFNIGAALWFSSRGQGYEFETKKEYHTKARVILSGLGSDEQLAGYRRHFSRFRKESWNGMNNELALDTQRIWIRNLERDDRLISYHGRECRFPFLDEQFILHVASLPLWCIANPLEEEGKGDKKILREAAKLLKLTKTAPVVKRAMQFGTKISKISFKKLEGDDMLPNAIFL